MKKVLLSILVACTFAVTTTGCWGSFNATKKLYDWNGSFGNKFVNWAVFLVCNIIPVYPLAAGLVDALILNSVEFWTGSNPLAAGDTFHKIDAEGNSVTAVKMEDGSLYMNIKTAEGDSQELVLQRDEDVLRILDTKGQVITEAAYAE